MPRTVQNAAAPIAQLPHFTDNPRKRVDLFEATAQGCPQL